MRRSRAHRCIGLSIIDVQRECIANEDVAVFHPTIVRVKTVWRNLPAK